MSDTPRSYPGIGFPGLLALIFITLKLTHVIDWSWWWVLAPVWISFAIFFAILLVWFGVTIAIKFFTR